MKKKLLLTLFDLVVAGFISAAGLLIKNSYISGLLTGVFACSVIFAIKVLRDMADEISKRGDPRNE